MRIKIGLGELVTWPKLNGELGAWEGNGIEHMEGKSGIDVEGIRTWLGTGKMWRQRMKKERKEEGREGRKEGRKEIMKIGENEAEA